MMLRNLIMPRHKFIRAIARPGAVHLLSRHEARTNPFDPCVPQGKHKPLNPYQEIVCREAREDGQLPDTDQPRVARNRSDKLCKEPIRHAFGADRRSDEVGTKRRRDARSKGVITCPEEREQRAKKACRIGSSENRTNEKTSFRRHEKIRVALSRYPDLIGFSWLNL